MAKHPYVNRQEGFFNRLPDAIQKGLIEHRKNQLNNTNFKWTGYDDCPFVNRKQIDEYKSISEKAINKHDEAIARHTNWWEN